MGGSLAGATAVDIEEVLGGRTVFSRKRTTTAVDLHARIREGFPYQALEQIVRRFVLPKAQLSRVLALPPTTESRRRREKRLSPLESDRLYRLARVLAHARKTLGGDEAAGQWLRQPNRALGGATPLDRLETELGAHEVQAVLGRLDHGIVG